MVKHNIKNHIVKAHNKPDAVEKLTKYWERIFGAKDIVVHVHKCNRGKKLPYNMGWEYTFDGFVDEA
jgi:hypothetical protein